MKSLERLKQHCQFVTDYDCYVLLAIVRKKDIEEITHSKEIVIKEIIKNKDEIESKYNKVKNIISSEKYKQYPFYFYVSVNARDTKKATFSLLNRMNKYIQEETNGINHGDIFKRIDRLFYSELMKPSSAGKNRKFLIDIDTKDENILKWINNLLKIELPMGGNIPYLKKYETRHGFHFVTNPFFVTQFINNLLNVEIDYKICEVKKDALLFLEYIER